MTSKNYFSCERRLSLPLVLLFLLVPCFSVFGQEWRPVSPAELAMKEPKVDKEADAEALFWETRLDDKKLSRLTISHYVRLKIFTERGREKFSKLDIPFTKGKKIEDVAARVIKPDGTIVNLAPTDIFEREVAKVGKARFMAKSFAVPAIEPGVIVEYQYVETIKGDSVGGERLIFQRDIPMQKVTYLIRPFGKSTLKYNWYNIPEARFRDDPANKGYQVATLYDVPAYKDEPYMPPDDEVRQWAYVSYNSLGALAVWPRVAQVWDLGFKELTKPKKEVKALATQLTAGATTEEEKLRRLYDYCKNEIKNITFDRSLTDEQREDLKIKDADDVLKRKMGNTPFIDLLFASLARSLDFEVVIALMSDRSENFFNPEKYPFNNFIEPTGIGVKIGGKWKVYSPGTPYLGFGETPWYRENVRSMFIGDGGYLWITTSMSEPDFSKAVRNAKLKLEADGTLKGSVSISYTGHQAISRRREEFQDSESKRIENLKDEIKSKMSSAEITNVTIENFEDSSKPLVYRFDVTVPGYAAKAGRRMILQPGFFEYGSKPVFSSEKREYGVYFPYGWAEEDQVEIKLPEGHQLEEANSPGDAGDPGNISSHSVKMQVNNAEGLLIYRRKFHFGGGGNVFFKAETYPAIKQLFDVFHKNDMHSVLVRPVQ